jgi:aminopeptidase N
VVTFRLPDPASGALAFGGVVSLTVRASAATSCVILHAAGLNVSSATAGGQPATSITYEADNDFLVLEFADDLPVHTAVQVTMDYTGGIQDARGPGGANAFGLFLCQNSVPEAVDGAGKHMTPAGVHRILREQAHRRWQRRGSGRRNAAAAARLGSSGGPSSRGSSSSDGPLMLATQFEEKSARLAFPCMDEPALKATFSVRVILPADSPATAFSNTPLAASGTSAAGRFFNFSETLLPLPTYLVAVAVGQFDLLNATAAKVNFRLLAPPGKGSWGQHGLNCSVHAVEYFGRIFNMPYSSMNSKMVRPAGQQLKK